MNSSYKKILVLIFMVGAFNALTEITFQAQQ